MPKHKGVTINLYNEKEAIRILQKALTGKVFNFTSMLAGNGVIEDMVSDQRLSLIPANPVVVEERGTGDHREEYIVLTVEDIDDLLIRVARWKNNLQIDFSSPKTIIISNNDKDVYRIDIVGEV